MRPCNPGVEQREQHADAVRTTRVGKLHEREHVRLRVSEQTERVGEPEMRARELADRPPRGDAQRRGGTARREPRHPRGEGREVAADGHEADRQEGEPAEPRRHREVSGKHPGQPPRDRPRRRRTEHRPQAAARPGDTRAAATSSGTSATHATGAAENGGKLRPYRPAAKTLRRNGAACCTTERCAIPVPAAQTS